LVSASGRTGVPTGVLTSSGGELPTSSVRANASVSALE